VLRGGAAGHDRHGNAHPNEADLAGDFASSA
jgi:hypothetical protein